jgi:hypothetical protein
MLVTTRLALSIRAACETLTWHQAKKKGRRCMIGGLSLGRLSIERMERDSHALNRHAATQHLPPRVSPFAAAHTFERPLLIFSANRRAIIYDIHLCRRALSRLYVKR